MFCEMGLAESLQGGVSFLLGAFRPPCDSLRAASGPLLESVCPENACNSLQSNRETLCTWPQTLCPSGINKVKIER